VKNYKLVEVIWVDAEEHGEIGWNELKAMKVVARKPCPTMKTVGYILFESHSHISLISTIGDQECSSLNKIPTAFIKEIRELIPSPSTTIPDPKPGPKPEKKEK